MIKQWVATITPLVLLAIACYFGVYLGNEWIVNIYTTIIITASLILLVLAMVIAARYDRVVKLSIDGNGTVVDGMVPIVAGKPPSAVAITLIIMLVFSALGWAWTVSIYLVAHVLFHIACIKLGDGIRTELSKIGELQ
jgi:uncharacterized membrane protein